MVIGSNHSPLFKLRLGCLLLGILVADAQVLVEDADGSGLMCMLFQTHIWSAPNIHYSDGDGWTTVPGFPMVPSTYPNYSSSDGWFQYELETEHLEFVFNDGNGVWDNNNNQNYLVEHSGTWSVVSQVTEQPTPQPEQPLVTTTEYYVTNAKDTGKVLTLQLKLNASSVTDVYGSDVEDLVVEVTKSLESSIGVKIIDKKNERWQVPRDLYAKGELGDSNYGKNGKYGSNKGDLEFTYTKNPFTFKVTRKADNYVVFDSSALALTVKDQYVQVATALSDDINVYGAGESTHSNMRLNTGDRHTLWARDQGAMDPNLNLYGSHPFFLGINGQGNAHGVLLLNSNGMDMTLESNRLVYQVLGGVLDFHILAGPTPLNVVTQYTELIGKPKLMPYWSYGFHQCRWGYNSTDALRYVVDQYAANNIPLDVMWADIDYMDAFHDFTLDPVNFKQEDVQKLLSDIHARGQKFVPIIDPGIPDDEGDYAYTRGLEMDIFIKDVNGTPYLGQVWPGPTVFPDFFHPKAYSYWSEQLQLMHKTLPYDGLWIDMNELANFCPGTHCVRQENVTCPNTGSISKITTCCLACEDDGNKWDNPPFQINNANSRASIYSKAVSTSSLQYGGIRQYDSHNLYGFTEAIATNTAQEKLFGKRSFVLSRSTFPGSGAYAAHWTGDNAATWNDLQWSIPTILNFGMYGIPMVGADICGFSGTTTEELCARWTALGSFYPFSRNHNNLESEPQETYVWSSVAAIGKKFIGMRYRLLPYIYTLGYEAHVSGLPIARALFMEFPSDANVRTSPLLDNQFMLGDALLVTPVLTQGATSVSGYLPAGKWYNIFDNSTEVSTGAPFTWNVSLDDMPVHVRGGKIVPMHQAALTSTAARKTPFDILVALSADATASGKIYLDDGGDNLKSESKATYVEFTVKSGAFTNKVVQNKYNDSAANKKINKLVVLGVAKKPSSVRASSSKQTPTFTYDAATQRLTIDLSKSNLQITDNLNVSWK